jgi:uncharacterized membrane protein YfhO
MFEGMIDFLRGGTMVALFAIGLYFFRFWRDSNDRLFAWFSAAFFIMAFSQKAAMFWRDSGDHAPYAYWLRLIAFFFIIIGIVEKNMPNDNSKNNNDL